MAYTTIASIQEFKELWAMLFPQIEPPADSQLALWFLQHDLDTVREGIVQLAAKYRKLHERMEPLYMLKFASAVMNRITRTTKERQMSDTNAVAIHETQAALAARDHLLSEIEKGEALLQRLPPNATHGDMKHLIQQDHDTILASVEQHPSLNKGVHEAK